MLGLAEREILAVRWDHYHVMTGPATGVGDSLLALLGSTTREEADKAWRQIENKVFAQDDISDAAEPTISIMLAALVDERSPVVLGRVFDLLFFLLRGAAVNDPELEARCRARGREGMWLLVKEARQSSPGPARDQVLEVLELVASDRMAAITSWLAVG